MNVSWFILIHLSLERVRKRLRYPRKLLLEDQLLIAAASIEKVVFMFENMIIKFSYRKL